MKREYPDKPIVGVGAVIIQNGKILLVKRGSDPGRNKWSVPGGVVELGEKVHETIVREVREETNLAVEVHSLIDFAENLMPDKEEKMHYHFVILDFFVRLIGGSLKAGSDVLDVRWVSLAEVKKYDLTSNFRDFFERNRELLKRFDSCL